jgi:nitrate/nitrite transport system ATP-binding protein
MSNHWLSIEGIGRNYGDRTVFRDLWFHVDHNEFVALIGHSGCGKTTVLNILSGLEKPDSGVLFLGGKEITGPSLERAVIFQSHALLPWLSALDNVAFAVRSRNPQWSRAQVRGKARQVLELVGLGDAADRTPSALSGGMKQRVGIARALSIEPSLLLMDEPFSALDALTRGTLQEEIIRLVNETRQTVFMITHDVDEAILLADKIILMRNATETNTGYRPGGIAEVVMNPLPVLRQRADLHHLDGYYDLRNHIVDFLVGHGLSISH